MEAIAPVNPLGRYYTQQSTARTVIDSVQGAGKEIKKISSFGTNLFLLLSGLFVTGGFGLGKSLAPDHTFIDRFSLVGIIGGIVTAIFGGYRLYKGHSAEVKNQQADIPTYKISKEVSKQSTEALGKVNTDSNNDFKLTKKILSGEKDDALITAGNKLIEVYMDPEFSKKITDRIGNGDSYFQGADGSNSLLLASQLKERLMLLIGYTVGTASRSNGTINSDTKAHEILNTTLALDSIEKGECDTINLLPEEARLVYLVARNYKLRHNAEDSLKTYLKDEEQLKTALSGNNIDSREKAEKDIQDFLRQHNYLKILGDSIKFVLTVEANEASGKADAKLIKKKHLVKSALITALELDTTASLSVTQQLERILSDDPNKPTHYLGPIKGVKTRTKEAEDYLNKLREKLQEGNTGYHFGSRSVIFPDIFSSSQSLIELEKSLN